MSSGGRGGNDPGGAASGAGAEAGTGLPASVVDRVANPFGESVNALQALLLVVSLAALLTAPYWGEDMLRSLALACVWAIFAMSWDIQSGYTGYISFGHAVLSGGAAYTTAIIIHNVDPEASMYLTIPVSVGAALVVGLLIALPSLRLHGPYFSLLTFVAALFFYRMSTAFSDYTGGELGVRVDVFTYDPVQRYYYMLVPMLAIAAVLTYVSRSNVGTVFVAIRENEPAVEAAGLDTTKFKLWSFVLSAIPMGIGGVLLAHFGGTVTPATFLAAENSIEMIAMAVLGGMSSVLGPIGGAFLFVLLRDEVLHGHEYLHEYRWVSLWLLVLGVLVFARHGLFRIVWHVLGKIGSRGDRG